MKQTLFSLIAPSPHDPAVCRALAGSLMAFNHINCELILAGPMPGGELRDDLWQAAADSRVTLIPCEDSMLDQTALLDMALARARGRIVCLLPPGCYPAPGLAAALGRFAADPSLAVMAGEVRPSPSPSPLVRLSAWEEEYYGQSGHACLAMLKEAALQAGGLAEAPGQPELAERLASLGRSMASDPDLACYLILPDDWAGVVRRQIAMGAELFHKRRKGVSLSELQERGLIVQQLLMIALLAILISFLPWEPTRALSLGVLCILLLYPLNRGFLRFLSQKEPELVNQGLWLCLMRPALRLAGGLRGALSRFMP